MTPVTCNLSTLNKQRVTGDGLPNHVAEEVFEGVKKKTTVDLLFDPLWTELKPSNQAPNVETFKDHKNRFHGNDSARLHSLAGRYDNHIPTRFQAP